jgi:hypothetical protein
MMPAPPEMPVARPRFGFTLRGIETRQLRDLTGFDVHPRKGLEVPTASAKLKLTADGPQPGDTVSMTLDGELLVGQVLDDGSVTLRPPPPFYAQVGDGD